MIARVMVVLSVLVMSTGCSVGACLGEDGLFGHTYCYSDFDESECDDYASEGVNDATWSFHAGQTCDDLGYLEGSN